MKQCTLRYPHVTHLLRAGFTLIEVSVVIIIMAILLGAVLAGSEVIKNVEEQVLIKQIKEYESGISVFLEKYKYYPGDFPNADTYWNTSISGDGNWQISSTEALHVANHLTISESLDGNFTGGGIILLGSNMPKASFANGGLWFHTYSDLSPVFGKTGESIDVAALTNTSTLANGIINAERAFRLDSRFDDGIPNVGYIYASNGSGISTAQGCVSADSNAPLGSNVIYNLWQDNDVCRLHFWFDQAPEHN